MKQEHQVFVNEYIATGDRNHAYKKAYPGANGEALKTAARRLMRDPEVKESIATATKAARQKATEKLERDTLQQLIAELENIRKKRKILAQMIDGEYKVKRHVKLKDHIEEVEDDLNPYALLRAMELDTKLAKEEQQLTRLMKEEERTDEKGGTPEQQELIWDVLVDGLNNYNEEGSKRPDEEKANHHRPAEQASPPSPGGTKRNNTPPPRHRTRRGNKVNKNKTHR